MVLQTVSKRLVIGKLLVVLFTAILVLLEVKKLCHERRNNMTHNQLAYMANLETQRSNKTREIETQRDNQARVYELFRSASAKLSEENRANVTSEGLRNIDIVNQYLLGSDRNYIEAGKASEQARTNRENEAIRWMQNYTNIPGAVAKVVSPFLGASAVKSGAKLLQSSSQIPASIAKGSVFTKLPIVYKPLLDTVGKWRKTNPIDKSQSGKWEA